MMYLLIMEMIFAGLKSSATGVFRVGATSRLLDGIHQMLQSSISNLFSFCQLFLFSLSFELPACIKQMIVTFKKYLYCHCPSHWSDLDLYFTFLGKFWLVFGQFQLDPNWWYLAWTISDDQEWGIVQHSWPRLCKDWQYGRECWLLTLSQRPGIVKFYEGLCLKVLDPDFHLDQTIKLHLLKVSDIENGSCLKISS